MHFQFPVKSVQGQIKPTDVCTKTIPKAWSGSAEGWISNTWTSANSKQRTWNCILLGLLDLSAAFDCVDNDILLNRLHDRFGISQLGKICFTLLVVHSRFFLNKRWPVRYTALQCVVRQGSVLGPTCILFLLYRAELFEGIAGWGFTGDVYNDDTQVHISTPATDQLAAHWQCLSIEHFNSASLVVLSLPNYYTFLLYFITP